MVQFYIIFKKYWLFYMIFTVLNVMVRSSAGDIGSVSKDKTPIEKANSNKEQVSANPTTIITKIKKSLKMTENMLGNMLESSSIMYTSRDKDDGAIETIHNSVVIPHSLDIPAEIREANEFYDSAIKLLNSEAKNKLTAYDMLDKAIKLGHVPSKLKLAWDILLGKVDRKLEVAKDIFIELADGGEPDAHMALGFLYSVGITGPHNQARGLVHYILAALGGNVWSQIVLGYRYKSGVNVAQNCEKSLQFYRMAAKAVAKNVSPSGGNLVHRLRLFDVEELGAKSSHWSDTDLIQYYEYIAEKGDLNAQIILGQLYYHGVRGCPKDLRKAEIYLTLAAQKGSSEAMAYLGKIYWEQGDEAKGAGNLSALNLFKMAAARNNSKGFAGLGMVYMEGKGVEKDLIQAKRYFLKSADLGWVEGQLHLGVIYLQGLGVPKDYRKAFKYLHLAAQNGHILAYFYLAQMHDDGTGILRSCSTAVELYKSVAERGKWNEFFMSGGDLYKSGRYYQAFIVYTLLSEMGYEVGQSNAAYMLEKGPSSVLNISEEERYVRAFYYWRRAAEQGYPIALVKLGDYYYYGQGVQRDYEAAASHYRLASHRFGNAQAMFNIGYMHEQGLGLSKDFALAKRFYDLAASISPDATVPVFIALVKLGFLVGLEYIVTLVPTPSDKRWIFPQWDVYVVIFLFTILCLLVNRRNA